MSLATPKRLSFESSEGDVNDQEINSPREFYDKFGGLFFENDGQIYDHILALGKVYVDDDSGKERIVHLAVRSNGDYWPMRTFSTLDYGDTRPESTLKRRYPDDTCVVYTYDGQKMTSWDVDMVIGSGGHSNVHGGPDSEHMIIEAKSQDGKRTRIGIGRGDSGGMVEIGGRTGWLVNLDDSELSGQSLTADDLIG